MNKTTIFFTVFVFIVLTITNLYAESVRITYNPLYPPFMFLDRNNEPAGMMIDLSKLWAGKADINPEFIPADTYEGIELVKRGKADICITIQNPDERFDDIDFVIETIDVYTDLFVDDELIIADIRSGERIKIGIMKDYYTISKLTQQYPKFSIQQFEDYDSIIMAAMNDEIQGFAMEYPIAMYHISKHDALGMFRQYDNLYKKEIKIGVNSNDKSTLDLLTRFNEVQMHEIKNIYKKWAVFNPLIPKWIVQITATVFLSLLFIILIAFVFILRSKVKHRTMKLEEALERIKIQNSMLENEVTERKNAEQALSDERNLLRTIIDNIPDLFFMSDRNEVLVKWNKKFEDATGFTAEELYSRELSDFFTGSGKENITSFLKSGPEEQAKTFEAQVQNKFGESILFEFILSMLIDESGGIIGFVGIGRDITERKQYEEALKNSEERFRSIFQLTDVAIWETEFAPFLEKFKQLYHDGVRDFLSYLNENPSFLRELKKLIQIVDMNEASLKLYGADSKDELVDNLDKIFVEESNQVFPEIIEAITSGKNYIETETVRQTLQGEKIHIIIKIRIPGDGDAFKNMLITTIDLTSQKKHEEELRKAKVDAELANRAKSTFLTNMSHELRTPLNSVIAMSDILLEQYFGELNNEQEDYIRDIRESGQHLLNLINDILDLSKVEAGYSPLEFDTVDMGDLLESSLVVVREKAMKESIELSCNINGDIPGIIADERKIKQVVFNLLSNAVKFTLNGGSVGIDAEMKNDHLEVCVWDTGIGITGDNLNKIFGEFYQAEESLTKKYQGTGLGLSLVKRFVEQHGGEIRVDSEPDKGSRFCFTLPKEPSKKETRIKG